MRGEKGTERTTDVMIASPNRERWDRRSDEEDNVRRFAPASSSTGGSSVRFRCARCLSASLTFCTAIFANTSNLLHSREEVQADFSAWASGGNWRAVRPPQLAIDFAAH